MQPDLPGLVVVEVSNEGFHAWEGCISIPSSILWLAQRRNALQKRYVCISSSAQPDNWLGLKRNLPKLNRSTAHSATGSTFCVHAEEHRLGAYNFHIFQRLQLNGETLLAAEGLVQLSKLVCSREKKRVVVRREPDVGHEK